MSDLRNFRLIQGVCFSFAGGYYRRGDEDNLIEALNDPENQEAIKALEVDSAQALLDKLESKHALTFLVPAKSEKKTTRAAKKKTEPKGSE